jgi:hypothetical protein
MSQKSMNVHVHISIHEQKLQNYWSTSYKTGEEIRLPELLEHFTSSFILKSPGVFGDWPRDLVMSRRLRGLATERRRDEAKLGYFLAGGLSGIQSLQERPFDFRLLFYL